MKEILKNLLKYIGYEIRAYNPANMPLTQIISAIKYAGCDIVFDIGANKGQFSREIREYGYSGKIVSFEPLSSVRKTLEAFADGDSSWDVHEQLAIGDQNCEIEVNISSNTVSSSILPMLETHSKVAMNSRYINTEKVSMARLDSIASRYLSTEQKLFIKIDTQGYESQVLDGAHETLKQTHGVLCELSLVSLYEGQKLWRDIIERLESEGFVLWALQRGFSDKKTGQVLQMDGIFLRI